MSLDLANRILGLCDRLKTVKGDWHEFEGCRRRSC